MARPGPFAVVGVGGDGPARGAARRVSGKHARGVRAVRAVRLLLAHWRPLAVTDTRLAAVSREHPHTRGRQSATYTVCVLGTSPPWWPVSSMGWSCARAYAAAHTGPSGKVVRARSCMCRGGLLVPSTTHTPGWPPHRVWRSVEIPGAVVAVQGPWGLRGCHLRGGGHKLTPKRPGIPCAQGPAPLFNI